MGFYFNIIISLRTQIPYKSLKAYKNYLSIPKNQGTKRFKNITNSECLEKTMLTNIQ